MSETPSRRPASEADARDQRLFLMFSVPGLLLLLGGGAAGFLGLPLPAVLVRYSWILLAAGVVLVLVGQQFRYRSTQRRRRDASGGAS